MFVQNGGNIIKGNSLNRHNIQSMGRGTKRDGIRQGSSRIMGTRTSIHGLSDVEEILGNDRAFHLLVSNRFSNTLGCDHVRFVRNDARLMNVAVFEPIRMGLDPTVDKLDVTDLVAEGNTGCTYII